MATPHPLRPDPPRILVLTTTGRRETLAGSSALGDLVAIGGVETDEVALGTATPPDPRAYGAVVVAGDPSAALSDSWLADLSSAVEAGTSLVALFEPGDPPESRWTDWLGVRPAGEHPLGEWFVKVAFGGGGLADRVPCEFPVVDQPVCLEATSGDTLAVLQVNIAFTDRTVATERRAGEGRIFATGLGSGPAALANPEVRTVLRRALAGVRELSLRGRSVGLGVLGYGPYGGMGLYHGLAANATEGLEMIAACDSDPERRKAAETEFPGLRAYEEAAQLIADENVEVVVVATPPSSHFSLARLLLDSGRHVALEKPMCLTVAEADELVAVAARNELTLTVHQSRRWDPDFLAVKKAVDAGRLGEVFNVETFVGGYEHPCRAWHSEVAISGGAVYDWGSHHLDWILQLMGDFPDHLVAHGHKRVWRDITNLDQVRVHLTWLDGREAEFVQSDVAGIRRPKFYVQGTKGTLAGHYRPLRLERIEPGVGYVGTKSHHAEAPVQLTLAAYEPGYGLTETTLPPAPADRYGFHRNLADHLTLGEPLAVTPESARDVVALLEAAQRSTDEGNIAIDLSRSVRQSR
ncbi:MAG: Gfo/Idh/MocA family protein [Acidimicrobiales bacterium]